jgi:hypothetical protein
MHSEAESPLRRLKDNGSFTKRQTFLEALDLKLRKAKRAKAKRERHSPASNDIMARLRIEDRARSKIR